MPLGKYYCDYCDKQFQDTPAARKRHLQGLHHHRARALWYDSFKGIFSLSLLVYSGTFVCRYFLFPSLKHSIEHLKISSSPRHAEPHGAPLFQPYGSLAKGVCHHFVRTVKSFPILDWYWESMMDLEYQLVGELRNSRFCLLVFVIWSANP